MAHLCVFTKIKDGASSTWVGATENPYESLKDSAEEEAELLPWALFFNQGHLYEVLSNALEPYRIEGGWYLLEPEEVTERIATLSQRSFSGYRAWHARARRLKV